MIQAYDYVFAENGLVAYKAGELIAKQSLKSFLGEEKLKAFINFVLHYVADLDIPIKRGTFVEFRNGMLNVSPIGRNCSQEERDEFEKYDHAHGIRCASACGAYIINGRQQLGLPAVCCQFASARLFAFVQSADTACLEMFVRADTP